MLLVLRLVHMFVIKGPTKYGFCPLFARPLSIELFFWESALICAHSFFRTHFFKKSWALRSWCAHNIFISCHYPFSRTCNSFLAVRSSVLSLYCPLTNSRYSILISRWLMFSDRSLFYIARHSLAASRLLLFTRWSLLRSRSLLVFTH